jgi:hypothetical protein
MTFKSQNTTLNVKQDNTVVSGITAEQRAAFTQEGAQLTEYVQSLFSLVLYDTSRDATLAPTTQLDPAGRTQNAEYFFRVPPKVLEQDEPFATTITPTQDGGKFVESYGSILKSIKVSGTTGLRPNKIAPSTVPLLGISDDQLETLAGQGLRNQQNAIPRTEATGWDDIIFLRNIFRQYSDAKGSDALAGKVLMLWRNAADLDYWVVEPEDFRLSRNSHSPLTYEYSISLRTLARFDFSYATAEDTLAAARNRQRMLSRLQEYGQNIMNIFMTVRTQITRLQGLATFVSNTILNPLLNVVNGITAVRSATFGVVKGLRTQVTTLIDNLDTALDRLVELEFPAGVTDDVDLTDLLTLGRPFKRAKIILARILSEPVCAEPAATDANRRTSIYRNQYRTPGTGTLASRAPSVASTVGREAYTSSVGADRVAAGETIRDIAARLLGDPGDWRSLVILNRLRAPFVAAVGSPGVLGPGDAILYPKDNGGSTAVVNSQLPSGGGNPVIDSYGVDLRLASVYDNGQEYADLAVGQDGDLEVIAGIDNVKQALNIKFLTERGELSAHTKFGAKFPTGSKATSNSFNEFRINILNTINSDSRVSKVKALQLVASGDKLAGRVEVELANTRDTLQTSLALRRF